MADETIVADTWLYETLTGDTALMAEVNGVHSTQASQAVALPYVVFEWLAGTDVMYVNAHRVWHSGVWVVRAVAQTGSWNDLSAAADRIDVLLHRESGFPTGWVDVWSAGWVIGRVFSSVRESAFRNAYSDEGRQYRELGGRFRIDVQKS